MQNFLPLSPFDLGAPGLEQPSPGISNFLNMLDMERKIKALQGYAASPPADATSITKPEEDETDQLTRRLMEMIERRSDSERERRIQELRGATPQDIYRDLHGQYWGNPKSKAGKVGSAALQVATGLFGAPTPPLQDLSMRQWQANQQAANQAESSGAREFNSALQGLVNERKTQMQERKANADRDAKMRSDMIKASLGASKLDIERMALELKKQGMDDQSALAQARAQWYRQKADPVFNAMSLPSIEARVAAMRRAGIDEETINEMARTHFMDMAAKQYKPGTPDTTTVSQGQQLFQDASGGIIPMPKQTQTFRPGKPAVGLDPLDAARGFLTGQRQSLSPGAPQPVPTPQAPLLQAQQQQPGGVRNAPSGAAPRGQKLPPPRMPEWGTRAPDQSRPSAQIIPNPNTNYVGFIQKPMTGPERTADTKARTGMATATSLLETAVDASLKGTLKTGFGADLLTNARRIFGIGDEVATRDLVELQKYVTDRVATHLNAISGAQVSDAEFQRIRKTFPQMDSSPESFMNIAYMTSVAPRVLLYLESLGVLNKATQGSMSAAINSLLHRYRDQFLEKNRMAAETARLHPNMPKETRDGWRKNQVNPTMDIDKIAAEIMGEAFQMQPGETKRVPYWPGSAQSYSGDEIEFRIPLGSKDLEDQRRKAQIEKAREAARKRAY